LNGKCTRINYFVEVICGITCSSIFLAEDLGVCDFFVLKMENKLTFNEHAATISSQCGAFKNIKKRSLF